ncbi:MAG: TolB family protein [Acidiferrobacterales bacterium]
MNPFLKWSRRLRGGFVIVLLGFSSWAHAAVSFDSSLTWRTLHSRHFSVHYHDGEEALALKAITIAEQVHARLSPFFGWTPDRPTDIVLSDRVDLANGYTTVSPYDSITLYVTPPDEPDGLEDNGGWLDMLISHEYTHVLHGDKATGAVLVLRHVFGRHYLLFPDTLQPSWLIEGLATYMETDTARGVGRGQSTFFDMLMRVEVANGLKPLHQINQPVTIWPAGMVPYLYGVKFYQFVAQKWGADRIQDLVDNYSSNVIPFRIDSNSRRVLGAHLDKVWDEFEQSLGRQYQPQIAAIRAAGEHSGKRVTRDGYFTSRAEVMPDGSVYYLRADGKSEPGLMVLRPGSLVPRRVANVHDGARMDVNAVEGALIAQPEYYRNANYFYDLYRIDLRSGAVKRLTYGARYRFAAWSPDGKSIVAVHEKLGRASLDLLDPRGRRLARLWSGRTGDVVADPSWSPDGQNIVAALWRSGTGWNLEEFTLAKKQWRKLTSDSAIKAQPRFTADGNAVLFSSDAGGVYNIRRLDLSSGQVTTLTRVEGGAFYPSQAATDGPVYYTGYGPGGFDVYRLDSVVPLPTPAVSPGPSGVPAVIGPPPQDLTTSTYSPYSALVPRWWQPHIAIDSGRTELGGTTWAWDPLQRHIYVADLAYDFKNRWPVGSIDYIYDRWFPILKLHAGRTDDEQVDSNGLPLYLRRSDVLQSEVVLPWLSYNRDWAVHLAALKDRDSDGWVKSGLTPRPETHDNLVGAAVTYDSTRQYLLSISRSNGQDIRLVAESSEVLGGSDYTGEVYTLDWREFLPLGGANVLALRFVEGWGTNVPRPFSLGGSRSATSPAALLAGPELDSPFDQRDYALRGYQNGLADLTGRRARLVSAEWRFPVRNVERGLMAPPVALDRIFGDVFVDSGGAWNHGDHPASYYTGAGVEANADTFLFYDLSVNLRLGCAYGFQNHGGTRLYLQAGASF